MGKKKKQGGDNAPSQPGSGQLGPGQSSAAAAAESSTQQSQSQAKSKEMADKRGGGGDGPGFQQGKQKQQSEGPGGDVSGGKKQYKPQQGGGQQQHQQKGPGQEHRQQGLGQQHQQQEPGQQHRQQGSGQQQGPRQQPLQQGPGKQHQQQGSGQQHQQQGSGQQHQQQGSGQQQWQQGPRQQPQQQGPGQQHQQQGSGQQQRQQGPGQQQARQQGPGQRQQGGTWGQQPPQQQLGGAWGQQPPQQQTRQQQGPGQQQGSAWGQQPSQQQQARQHGPGQQQQGGSWGQQPPQQQQARQQGSGPQQGGAWGQRPAQQQGGGGQRGAHQQRGQQQGEGQRGANQQRGQQQGEGQRGPHQQHEGQRGPYQQREGQRGGQQQRGQQQGEGQRGSSDPRPAQQQRRPQSGDTTPTSISSSESVQSIASGTSRMSIGTSKRVEQAYVPSGIPVQKGKSGRPITVDVNYLDVNIDKMENEAWQYDVQFDPDKPKKFLRLAFSSFSENILQKKQILMAFDGQKIAYCATRIGGDILNKSHEVSIIEPDTKRERKYKVIIKETLDPKIELSSLKNYRNERIFDKPMRAVQCLDVILRSAPSDSGKSVRAGRSFYIQPPRSIDLRDGYELWFGLFQAVVLGDKPFLNIDVCHKAFPSSMHVMDRVSQVCRDLRGGLDYRAESSLQSFLRGLDVMYKPPGAVEKRYKCNGLGQTASRATFDKDGQIVTVAQYFSKDKGIQLKYPDLPCLDVGPKHNLFPMEFCTIPAGQAINKKTGENQVREIIKSAATSTDVRKKRILDIFREFDYEKNPIIRRFNISLGRDFLNIAARIIDPPLLEYADRKTVQPFKGSWRLEREQFIVPKHIIEWAILITDYSVNDFNAKEFAGMMVKIGKSLNMNIADNCEIRKIKDDERIIEQELTKFKAAKKDLVVVVISGFQNSYSKIKQPAENKCGVLTQCIKAVTIKNRCNHSTIQNILLKVNAKLAGINHKIAAQSQPSFKFDDIMFLGADVTHPSPDQRSIPSVVGVAATHDRNGFQYNMRYRLQDPKQEIITDMEGILRDQLKYYKSLNGILPKKIIYYRDGVSDGQFEHVRKTEFTAMDSACNKMAPGYRPDITCIVVQKRHHTRFFPPTNSNIGKQDRKYNNVPPGTIVDSRITHPAENQFFMVSHESIQGVAKPTKYCLLRDDSKFNIDDLQSMTYSLCHMFTRCNRAVSYPAPAYYAHLAAYRGRVYIEGARGFRMDNLQNEYMRRPIKDEILYDRPMFFV